MFCIRIALLRYEKCVALEIQLLCGTSSQLEGTLFADTTSSRGSHDPLRDRFLLIESFSTEKEEHEPHKTFAAQTR